MNNTWVFDRNKKKDIWWYITKFLDKQLVKTSEEIHYLDIV